MQTTRTDINSTIKNENVRIDIALDTAPPQASQQPLSRDLKVAVPYVFTKILNIPYELQAVESHHLQIARLAHGIQHAVRVALYVSVFANLYRRYGHSEALNLTDEVLNLIQIAALLHDSARKNDGEDFWDSESAVNTYQELTKTFGVDKSKAKLIAEAVANKDTENGRCGFEIEEDQNGKVICKPSSHPYQRNIYANLLQAADALDIIRARPHFEGDRLYFYKDFIQQIENDQPLALLEFATLITEARYLISLQGDRYLGGLDLDYKLKKEYESTAAYEKLLALIAEKPNSLLNQLGHGLVADTKLKDQLIDTKPFDPKQGITQENLEAGLREGVLLARGIGNPTAFGKKKKSKLKKANPMESRAELEFRKILRKPGEKTLSGQSGKEGNKGRSTSLLGFGAHTFSAAGLVLQKDECTILDVSSIDCDSGHGKKGRLKGGIQQQGMALQDLHRRLMLGGESRFYAFAGYYSLHNEVLVNISRVSAVFYSCDHNLHNFIALGKIKPMHPYAPILQAIYIRQQYQQMLASQNLNNEPLPIIEYSAIENKIRLIPDTELTDEAIIRMWVAMCGDYMNAELGNNLSLNSLSLDDLKVFSMYNMLEIKNSADLRLVLKNMPADILYPNALKNKIDQALQQKRQESIKQYEHKIMADIQSDPKLLLSDLMFPYLIKNTSLLGNNSPVRNAVCQLLKTEIDLFENFDRGVSLEELIYVLPLAKNSPMVFLEQAQNTNLQYGRVPVGKIHFLATCCELSNEFNSVMNEAGKAWEANKQVLMINDVRNSHKQIQQRLVALKAFKRPTTRAEFIDSIEAMAKYYISPMNPFPVDVPSVSHMYSYLQSLLANIEKIRTQPLDSFSFHPGYSVRGAAAVILGNCYDIEYAYYGAFAGDFLIHYMQENETSLRTYLGLLAEMFEGHMKALARDFLFYNSAGYHIDLSTESQSLISMMNDICDVVTSDNFTGDLKIYRCMVGLTCSVITLGLISDSIENLIIMTIKIHATDARAMEEINNAICAKLQLSVDQQIYPAESDMLNLLVRLDKVLPQNEKRQALLSEMRQRPDASSAKKIEMAGCRFFSPSDACSSSIDEANRTSPEPAHP